MPNVQLKVKRYKWHDKVETKEKTLCHISINSWIFVTFSGNILGIGFPIGWLFEASSLASVKKNCKIIYESYLLSHLKQNRIQSKI